MRVHHHVKFLLAAAAIAHATKAKTTTSVAVSTTNSTTELSSTVGRDDGERAPHWTGKFLLGEKANPSQFPKEYKKIFEKAAKYEDPMVAIHEMKETDKHMDVQIVEMIIHGKMDAKRHDDALKLEEAHIKHLLEKKIAPKSAFYLLHLHFLAKDKNKLLADPLFHYWSTYVERFNEEYPDKKMSIIDVLILTLKDDSLTHLIVDAEKDLTTKSTALEWREEQLNHWLNEGLSADKVFELLGLDKVEDGLLTHPLFNYWYTYFEMALDKDTDVVHFLVRKAWKQKTSFENFLKAELEKANFETKDKVEKLFLELKLERVEDGLFTHPLFIFWRDCLEKFNRVHPHEQASVLGFLRKNYGDKGLLDLIKSQSKGTESEKYAEELEK